MEFIKNKVDINVRNKIEEQMKTDKIHSTKGISVDNDLKDNNKNQYTKSKKNTSKKKKVITVDGVKNLEDTLSIEVEKMESIGAYNSTGRFLDAKK